MTDQALENFAITLHEQVATEAALEDAETSLPEAFVASVLDVLEIEGELSEAKPCHFAARGVEVFGYGLEDDGTLNLIAADYSGHGVETLPAASVKRAMGRALEFWAKSASGLHKKIEESSEASDMARDLFERSESVRRIRVFLLTDRTSKSDSVEKIEHQELPAELHVWDLARLQRQASSGSEQDLVAVDFVDRFGSSLPCLNYGRGGDDYDVVLAVVPGEWLASLYEEFGGRLLEQNVRSFLQARGKVNKGIRDTLATDPRHFLAYNNGITATASRIEFELSDSTRIKKIEDLQIVNGGQTTVSLQRALIGKVPLEEVAVQAKITVIAPERLSEVVPRISRFANSQNKVSESDLSANSEFHIAMERYSRSIWAPAKRESNRQTRWFYERSRGQYAEAKFQEGTPARQRAWATLHPPAQRVAKTDLAKYENAWRQLPYEVSKGAQKNFVAFMNEVERAKTIPDETYFDRAMAKAILWKQTEKIVTAQNFGGYRANVVAYSIAKLSHVTGMRIDFDSIWRDQDISDALATSIQEVSHLAWRIIHDQAPLGRNVGEWAKSKVCWENMRSERWDVPSDLEPELSGRSKAPVAGENSVNGAGPAVESEDALRCVELTGEGWFELAKWARETQNLQPWQRSLAFSLGKLVSASRTPTPRQAAQGVRILDEVLPLGFEPSTQVLAEN